MTKQDAFTEINKIQDDYIDELANLMNDPNYESMKMINFTSPTGTGKTKMMSKLINKFPDYYFIITTLSKGQLHIQIRNSLEKDCNQDNFTVYGSADYKINSRLDAEDIIGKIPANTKCIWLRDEGHIKTNRFDELLLNHCYKVINFSATNMHSDIQCNFTQTMMLRTVNQTNGTPEDAIVKLLEVKEAHKDVANYNPCAIFRCVGGDDEIYNRIVAACENNNLKYIDITDETFVMSELCEDDSEYDVIINKFKIVEGIDIRRAHVLYMDNQPKNNATTIQVIGRCRRNALLYRNDIDILAPENANLLELTRECYVYYNVEKMKIEEDAYGELRYAFCDHISCEMLKPHSIVEVVNGRLPNGLYVIELEGETGKFEIDVDSNTGFNVVNPLTKFYDNICSRIDNADMSYVYLERYPYEKIRIDNIKRYIPITTDASTSSSARFGIKDTLCESYYDLDMARCSSENYVQKNVTLSVSNDILEKFNSFYQRYTFDYFCQHIQFFDINVLANEYSITDSHFHIYSDVEFEKYILANESVVGFKSFCQFLKFFYRFDFLNCDVSIDKVCSDFEIRWLKSFCIFAKDRGIKLKEPHTWNFKTYSNDTIEINIKQYVMTKLKYYKSVYAFSCNSDLNLFLGLDDAILCNRDALLSFVKDYISKKCCECEFSKIHSLLQHILNKSVYGEKYRSEFCLLYAIFSDFELLQILYYFIKEAEAGKTFAKIVNRLLDIIEFKCEYLRNNDKFISFASNIFDTKIFDVVVDVDKLFSAKFDSLDVIVECPASIHDSIENAILSYFDNVDNFIRTIGQCIFADWQGFFNNMLAKMSYVKSCLEKGVVSTLTYSYRNLFEPVSDKEYKLLKSGHIGGIVSHGILATDVLSDMATYASYEKIVNDKESAIIGTDIMKQIQLNGVMGWTESKSVSSKIGCYCKFNSFLSKSYCDELSTAKLQCFIGQNNFKLDKRCNSMIGYCVEYYSKYLVYGESFLNPYLYEAQFELCSSKIDNIVLIRACMLKYKDMMINSFGKGVEKVIKTISATQLLFRDYKYFVDLIVELGTRTANYVKSALYSNRPVKDDVDPNLSIRHIAGLADYITEDIILDVKVRNNIDEKCVRQVLAYHYLSTKRSDLHIKKVIVYDATSDRAVVIDITDKNRK